MKCSEASNKRKEARTLWKELKSKRKLSRRSTQMTYLKSRPKRREPLIIPPSRSSRKRSTSLRSKRVRREKPKEPKSKDHRNPTTKTERMMILKRIRTLEMRKAVRILKETKNR